MKALLDKIAGLKILVVGDIILDHYIWGDASRISPEAPVPVVEVERDSYVAGGAANVALNLVALGAKAELCGVTGKDDAGIMLRGLLLEHSVAYDDAFGDYEIPTILKTRVIVRQQQLCRLDREREPDAYASILNEHSPEILAKIENQDAVILSDYAKGALTSDLIEEIKKRAASQGALVAYDPKPKRRLAHQGLGLLTPNRSESLKLAGLELEPHQPYPAEEVCRLIWELHEPRHLIITLGAEGMLLSEEGRVLEIIPTYAREVFDVSGAGDTVIAALTASLAAGAKLEEAAHFANTAAGVVVAKLGTATASPVEILHYEAANE